MWQHIRRIAEAAGLIGTIVAGTGWVIGLGTSLSELKGLPQDMRTLSSDVKNLQIHVARLEGKIDARK